MADGLLSNESAIEFFKHEVEDAMARQHLKTSDWTSYYVVNLLATFAAGDRRPSAALDDEALGLRLARALQAEGSAQREALRRVGDHSLFLVGFFSDSLSNRLVDVDYYISLGGSAYGHLASRDEEAFADVFGEIAEKFVPLVDVLADISDRASIGTNRDLLRLYGRWVQTGSPRHGNLLTEMGILPSLSAPTRPQ
jgi:hypothetical protein